MSEQCNKCGGSGEVHMPGCTAPFSPCPNCGGTGLLPEMTIACAGCITLQAEVERLRHNSYPHMCRDGHQQIGHSDDKPDEMCPLCRTESRLDRLLERLEALVGEWRVNGMNESDTSTVPEYCATDLEAVLLLQKETPLPCRCAIHDCWNTGQCPACAEVENTMAVEDRINRLVERLDDITQRMDRPKYFVDDDGAKHPRKQGDVVDEWADEVRAALKEAQGEH